MCTLKYSSADSWRWRPVFGRSWRGRLKPGLQREKLFGKLVVAIKVGRGPTGSGCFCGLAVQSGGLLTGPFMALFPVRPAVYGGFAGGKCRLGSLVHEALPIGFSLDQWLKPEPRSLVNEAKQTNGVVQSV